MQQLLVRTTINYWPRGMELWFIWPFEARFRFQLVSAGNRLCAEYLSGFPRMHALTLCRSINDWIAKRKKRKKTHLATLLRICIQMPSFGLELAEPECTKPKLWPTEWPRQKGSCTQRIVRLQPISPMKSWSTGCLPRIFPPSIPYLWYKLHIYALYIKIMQVRICYLNIDMYICVATETSEYY